MNLFILDINPVVSASYHVDKHIVKMPTEAAQMISFVYHDQSFWTKSLPECMMAFSKTHYKHPCSIWIRESMDNFLYACELGKELYNEYQFRYNKPDKHSRAKAIFDFGLNNPPALPNIGLTKFAMAMDNEFISDNVIDSYRCYYRESKKHLHSWKNRNTPFWI